MYTYIPDFLSEEMSSYYFDCLKDELDWIRHPGVPRCEYYYNDTPAPYTYGVKEYAREYLPQPVHINILSVRYKLEEIVKCKMDVCFLNMYLDQRDSLGWHSDDSPEMDPERPIVTVSLGAVRDIQIRPIDDPAGIGKLGWSTHTLGNGSAFIMNPGCQQHYQHRIPKCGRVVGERISLTFRGYKEIV